MLDSTRFCPLPCWFGLPTTEHPRKSAASPSNLYIGWYHWKSFRPKVTRWMLRCSDTREQQSSVPSWFPTYPSMSSGYPVPESSEFQPNFGPDPERLAEEYPFSYPIAKELPHIFGNVDEDEVLERPLTPSFEPTSEFEFTDFVQRDAFDSCRYGGSRDFSCGFVSKGRYCNIYRQE